MLPNDSRGIVKHEFVWFIICRKVQPQEESVPVNKTRRIVLAAVGLTLMIVPVLLHFSPRAQNDASGPWSQSRIITPAGRLIVDAANGLPAVAPLTMNFVRTPDASGPDGRGRYLIAVN